MKISLCMIVKNEEKYIQRAIESVYKYVDEVIITDSGSTDKTLSIANKYTDKIYHYEWNGSFSDARNYCQSKAKGEYIIWLDADEYFKGDEGKIFIDGMKNNPKYDIFTLMRVNKGDINSQHRIQRGMKNNVGIEWENIIHERMVSSINNLADFEKNVELYLDVSWFIKEVNLYHVTKLSQEGELKYWNNINYYEKILIEDKNNSYIRVELLNYYINNNYFNKIKFVLVNTSIIYPRYLREYYNILKLLKQGNINGIYDEELIILKKILKKNLFRYKKSGVNLITIYNN